MMNNRLLCFLLFVVFNQQALALNENIVRSIWANYVIISTYTLSPSQLIAQQKEIAKFFTAKAWINYTRALASSKFINTIKNNQYQVSAVSMRSPEIKSLTADQWQAEMPVMVWYKNPQYQQKQTLNVTITFKKATANEGAEGYAITSFQSKVIEPLCQCKDDGIVILKKPENQNTKVKQN